jgi:hypothetical protein
MCVTREAGKLEGTAAQLGERGEEDERRGRTHRGIFSTTFGYAGGNTAIILPFWKNGCGTRCLPPILERCGILWNTIFSKKKKGQVPRPGDHSDEIRLSRYIGTWAGLKFSTGDENCHPNRLI